MIDYLEAFQVLLANVILIGMGYLTGGLKMFNITDLNSIIKIVHIYALPGCMFHAIAKEKMTVDFWKPFFISICVQVSLYFFIAVICFAFPFENKVTRFIEAAVSCTYKNILFLGYPMIKQLYGEDFTHIPVLVSLITFVLIKPLHTLLILKMKLKFHEIGSDDAEWRHDDINNGGIEDPEDHHSSDQEDGTQLENVETATSPVIDARTGNPVHDVSEENPVPEGRKLTDVSAVDIEKPDAEQVKESPLWKTVLFEFLSPVNICAILGIIYSLTTLKLYQFMEFPFSYLEKCVPAAGMFIIGVFMWFHPFKGTDWLLTVFYLCIHFIVMPLLGALWAFIFGCDNLTSQAIVMCYAMPAGLYGYTMALSAGRGIKAASYTFFWSNFLQYPVFMIWIAILNESGLFKVQ